MTQTRVADAVRELDRLEDWGRDAIDPELLRRLRRELGSPGVWGCVLTLIGIPQLIVLACLGFNSPWQLGAAVGMLLPAAYVVASAVGAPDLPPNRRRLWLFSKTVGTAVACCGYAAILAGSVFAPLALIALPAWLIAGVVALGTWHLRRGHLVIGVLPATLTCLATATTLAVLAEYVK